MSNNYVSPPDLQQYHKLQDEFIDNIPEYPGGYEGRGIVICAGRPKYFIPAWACIHMLRKLGCNLPIEIWYMGPQEMDQTMMDLVAPLGVTCVDALEVRKTNPVRHLGGWELNPYSIIHSKFKEIIFLDADNVPIVNPEFFFDTPQFKLTKSIFWPDFQKLAPDRTIWKICRVDYRMEAEFESGQIIIDKESCWRELQMTMHLNEHSDFYYQHIHGDKDTFHMAWHMMKTPYSMPDKPIHALRATMCQHDFEGRRIFQHRNMDKFKFEGNARITGFEYEEDCFQFVRDLRDKWNGAVVMKRPTTPAGTTMFERLTQTRLWDYERVGDPNKRQVEFLADGSIGRGRDRMEESWYIDEDKTATLHVVGGSGTTFTAVLSEDGFRGRWIAFEKMSVVLTPVAGATPPPPTPVPAVSPIPGTPYGEALENKRFIYIRVGVDKRLLEFRPNNVIGTGQGGLEKVWGVFVEDKKVLLRIGPTLDDPVCELEMGRDGVWRGSWTKFERMPVELVEIP
jgi:hypothetical protein